MIPSYLAPLHLRCRSLAPSFLILSIFLLHFTGQLSAAEPPTVRTAGSGPWSSTSTWERGQLPAPGQKVQILPSHTIIYDVASDEVIRSIHIGGSLTFARDRNTKLCVGLIKIQPGADTREEGFDCHAPSTPVPAGVPQAALEVGTVALPIPRPYTALIRLTPVEGLDPNSCPAIICCGGRMDLHGAPLLRTWVKLGRTNENSAEFDLELAERVPDWRKGDQILITGTRRQFPGHPYNFTRSVADQPQSETAKIGEIREERGHTILTTDEQPPANRHEGGTEFSAEVANLSRNVIVESADPDGVRGHTMYHRHSTGNLSYAEFRHLGKRDLLGRYPIHFHQCGTTMRGTSVVGLSIWDSHNRCLTIHGTDYLVVRDCIGYKSVGHAFFLEDGTETRNLLDRNLGVLALRGKPLPDQALAFDQNDGAAFWWSNSLNAFTRNVAAECDQHGYRFEVVASEKFNPVLPVLQPDGSRKPVDIRTLPFIRFDSNEAHTQRRFGINLGGFNGLSILGLPNDTALKDVDGVGPDMYHPFILRNTLLWDCDWAYHAGSPSVLNDRMRIHNVLYGIWRINSHLQEHSRLTMTDVVASGVFHPRASRYQKPGELEFIEPKDDLPPSTVITSCEPAPGGKLRVRGVTLDNGEVADVTINNVPARPLRTNYADWEAIIPAAPSVTAKSSDAAGNEEKTPHEVRLKSE
ncbi:G8 domain-containing protein [Verrucomicrobium sp. BvORR034]|uniref:G8 domain-containing protein n=1 Tax=Verrucomicrobium sp. BvORR034 TaxID=1396418 RepID=UPI00067912D3|nr:G8 domain-containing protein [Verrucomicrobium sp. BvORR034]